MDLDNLKADVIKLLVMEHGMLEDEAEEKVNISSTERPDLWHDNAEARDLANFLASDDDDE